VHGSRSTSASGGSSAVHTAIASSPPCRSPDGDETDTSASISRSARRAMAAAWLSTQWCTQPSRVRRASRAAAVNTPRAIVEVASAARRSFTSARAC
jgi:hypothetical protein